MKTHCLQHKDLVIAWVRIILALGTNHLNFGYESSGYETSVGTKRPVSDVSQERRMRISDRNSILMTLNLSGGIWSGALIGRRIVVTLFQLSYTNDDEKQRERTNGNAINLLQSSLYSWNIYCFFKKKHSSFAGACAKKNIKLRHNQIDKEKLLKSNKFIFRTAELPD